MAAGLTCIDEEQLKSLKIVWDKIPETWESFTSHIFFLYYFLLSKNDLFSALSAIE